MLADAGLLVQQATGIATEPLVVAGGREGIVAAAAGAGLLVIGLSERWRREGLGPTRSEIAKAAPAPVLFVRRGTRPGLFARRERHPVQVVDGRARPRRGRSGGKRRGRPSRASARPPPSSARALRRARSRAFAHPDQPEPLARPTGLEAAAVVLHGYLHAPGSCLTRSVTCSAPAC